jgi:hypothetical protein
MNSWASRLVCVLICASAIPADAQTPGQTVSLDTLTSQIEAATKNRQCDRRGASRPKRSGSRWHACPDRRLDARA